MSNMGRPRTGVRVEVRLPPETTAALDADAYAAGVTRAEWARRALMDATGGTHRGRQCVHCRQPGFVSIGYTRWYCLAHLTKAIAELDAIRAHNMGPSPC